MIGWGTFRVETEDPAANVDAGVWLDTLLHLDPHARISREGAVVTVHVSPATWDRLRKIVAEHVDRQLKK